MQREQGVIQRMIDMNPKPDILEIQYDNNRKRKPMDLELYRATIKGDVDNFTNTMMKISTGKGQTYSEIMDQLSPLQNTYLHVASSFGHHNLVGHILHQFQSLLTAKNSNGDTALHLAARSGHEETVLVLLNYCPPLPVPTSLSNSISALSPSSSFSSFSSFSSLEEENDEEIFVRMRNKKGNTALHEAMILGNVNDNLCQRLIIWDPEVLGYVNNSKKSPLYLAVEAGNVCQVELILDYYRCESPRGKSPVNAAISARNEGLLDTILGKVPSFIHLRDEKGGTPLHFAAAIGYFEGVQYLLGKYSESILARDTSGFLPIHHASRRGHVDIIEKLLHHCPDWRELLTNHGQNILHVAAERGKYKMVNHIVKTPGLEGLVNERDNSGNTPLHLATMNCHPRVVSTLAWGKGIDLNLMNKQGKTPLDIVEAPMSRPPSFRKRLTWVALRLAGSIPRKCKANSTVIYPPNMMMKYDDRVSTLFLLSTLMVIVTFAAGFTMPGGYNNSDPDQGMATMLNKPLFQAFVICDTIAMYSSITAAVSLIWAQLGDRNLGVNCNRLALSLLGISLSMMSLAFMAGLYLVVSRLNWLSNFIMIMEIVFLATLLALFIPLSIPTISSTNRVLRYCSYFIICLMMIVSGCYSDDDDEEEAKELFMY